MKINKDISQRITMLRFPMILGVILIHSYGISLKFSNETIGLQSAPYSVIFFQNLISDVIARIAIPIFFMISALLFFQNYSINRKIYFNKIRKRIHTLLVPYLIWNTLTIIFFLSIQSVPAFADYFSGRFTPISEYTISSYINAFLGITTNPISYQLWFIRDLMILVVISPVIWIIATRIPLMGALILSSLWMLDPAQIKYINLSYTAILFFYLGCCLACRDYDIKWIDRQGAKLLAVYLAITIMAAYTITSGIFTSKLIIYLSFIPGILSAWYLAGRAANIKGIANDLTWLSSFAFFVYAAHEPTLTFLRKIVFKLVNPADAPMILIVYMLIPIADVAITISAGYILKHATPRVYALMTGSR